MRTFVLSLAVLLALLVLLTLTGGYVASITATLKETALEMPALSVIDTGAGTDVSDVQTAGSFLEDAPAMVTFDQLWQECRLCLHWIVGHDDADRIEEAFRDARVRWRTGDAAGYMSARERLIGAITKLADSERLSLDAIT